MQVAIERTEVADPSGSLIAKHRYTLAPQVQSWFAQQLSEIDVEGKLKNPDIYNLCILRDALIKTYFNQTEMCSY